MGITKNVVITAANGESMTVPMYEDSGREVATLDIEGVKHYFERLKSEELIANYTVDNDPDYVPESDSDGCCYILAPFSQ